MRNIIRTVVPPLLIILFIYAGLSKWLTFAEFRGQLHNQPFPGWLADTLSYTLIPLELLAAVLLCFPGTQRAGLRLSFALMLSFTGYIALIMLHAWDRIPCSCGGIFQHMSWSTHLIVNTAFLALSVAGLSAGKPSEET